MNSAVTGLDLASELFHRINRVIPQNQIVLSVPPSCPIRDAVKLMKEKGYSQVPVIKNDEVLGIFSFRSFAKGAASLTLDDWTKQKCAPGDLTVDEFMEQFEFARVTDEMVRVFDAMDRDNGVLIGSPDRLVGVLTPMDFLRYLYQVASPFVMVSEIELALRALIRIALNEEQIGKAARRSLASAYGGDETKSGPRFTRCQTLVPKRTSRTRRSLCGNHQRHRTGFLETQSRARLCHFRSVRRERS